MNPKVPGKEPGEERTPGGGAERILAQAVPVVHGPCRQTRQVRRDRIHVPQRSNPAVQVIGYDQEHIIRLFRPGLHVTKQNTCEEKSDRRAQRFHELP